MCPYALYCCGVPMRSAAVVFLRCFPMTWPAHGDAWLPAEVHAYSSGVASRHTANEQPSPAFACLSDALYYTMAVSYHVML